MTTAKKLFIPNENNKLAQKTFIHINVAPPRAAFNKQGIFTGVITEATFNNVFVIDNNGTSVFVKLVDFRRILFKNICSYYTQQSSGKSAYLWKVDFMTMHPATTNQTEMAVYYYEKAD